MLTQKREGKKPLKPIPTKIMIYETFLPENLSEEEYRREVKKIIRKHYTPIPEPCWMQVFDEELSKLIEEVLAEN